jgi:hypothetical protein
LRVETRHGCLRGRQARVKGGVAGAARFGNASTSPPDSRGSTGLAAHLERTANRVKYQ